MRRLLWAIGTVFTEVCSLVIATVVLIGVGIISLYESHTENKK